MRFGLYHSVDVSSPDDNIILLQSLLWAGLELFVVLAGLLCGYIVAALASRTLPWRHISRDATVAGFVAGIVNLIAMVLIYFPLDPIRREYDVLNIGLYGVWYFVQIVVMSVAGAAIYVTLVRKPRRIALKGWPAAAAVGVVAAVLISVAYLVQSLFVVSFEGMLIGSSFEILIVQFAVDAFVLAAGVLAGLAAGGLVRRAAASPANYVLCTGLAGLIAGFFGTLAGALINLAMEYRPSSISGNSFWMSTAHVLNGSVLLVMLAVAGGVYYTLWRGDARFLSPEAAESIK
jgi:hypothetical protein